MPRAILLDLDDTIVAFDSVADGCWRALCQRFSREIGGIDAQSLFDVIGESRQWYWDDPERHRRGRGDLKAARRLIVRRAFEAARLAQVDVADRLADAYTEERERLVMPFTGAVETVIELRRRGFALALVTNGEAKFQRAKIERFELAQHFACIVVEGEFGIGKPDPSVFRHALATVECDARDAWMVGDSLVYDIAPAQALGLTGVWIDGVGAGLGSSAPCTPTRTIRTLAELIGVLDASAP